MKFERFDIQESFNIAAQNGIDLFLGSGFSIGAFDVEKRSFPIGNGLLKEIKEKFPQVENFSSLSTASTVLESTIKEEYMEFLTKRFTVDDFSENYLSLLNIKINNIYTTNIDNLLFNIFKHSTNGYINNTMIRGMVINGKQCVNYYPLHGCVENPEKGYVFSKTKIASAYTDQRDDWNNLRNTISNKPILFWGWSFEDSDAIEALYSNNSEIDKNTDKWILLYNPTKEELLFYEALGFKIIVSDTMQMLSYLNELEIHRDFEDDSVFDKEFEQYCIPLENEAVASYPLSSFFEGDAPRWSHIFSGEIAKLNYFANIKNDIEANKNVIVIGIPACGKTTLFMQLLNEYKLPKSKHMMIGPTVEEAKAYVNKVKSKKAVLFVDNCFRDVEAMQLLLAQGNIQLVGFDRDYLYEANCFRLRNIGVDYVVRDITEITDLDKRKILDSIPNDMKIQRPTINCDPTIFSLLLRNLKGQRFDEKFKKVVRDLYRTNSVATELFVMICYVHSCGVPVSYDMIYSYLRDVTTDYKEIYNYIEQVGNIIKECSDESFSFLNVDFNGQDYYQSRSRYFAELIIKNIPKDCPVLKNVLCTFVKNVPPFKICNYDVFKRKGFDADFTIKAFDKKEDAIAYYKLAASVDETEYLYQQAAIYFSRKKQHSLAFQWIDKARNITAYNKFSIDNTHAIIQFNANKDIEDVDGSVKTLLIDSLNKLKDCYVNDRRKPSHVKAFGQLSIEFYNRYGYEDALEYLELARDWITIEKESLDYGVKFKGELREIEKNLQKVLL